MFSLIRHTAKLALVCAALLYAPPAAACGAWSPAGLAGGKVFLTVEEALELAFPKAKVTRTTAYLDEAQEKRASKLAGQAVEKRVVHAYIATNSKGAVLGRAYFDTHVVRSKRETLMVVVAPDRTIRRVEVLAFAEPLEYMPRGAFYAQLKGRALDSDLAIGRAVRGVSGATLTTRVTVEAARRVLALHQVVHEAEEAKRKEEERRRKEEARRRRGDGGGV